MRNKVIKFLSELPAEPVAQFNEALQLYLQTPGHNTSIARYHNSAGYNPQRLSELLYDLKAVHSITPSDIVQPTTPDNIKFLTGQSPSLDFPQFSKGTKGNYERREYVEQHGLKAESNKNDDLDAAITKYLGDQLTAQQAAKTLAVDANNQEVIEGTVEERAFAKVLAVLRAGEEVPVSLVKELYADKKMTDDDAEIIIKAARMEVVDPHSTDATAPMLDAGVAGEIEVETEAEIEKEAKADTKKKSATKKK